MHEEFKKYKADLSELEKLISKNELTLCLDSRLVNKGVYFVAVVGDRLDGHDFIGDVIKKGAAGYIDENDLYELVKYKLDLVDPKVIGITGSSGKTTVTYFVYEMLSLKHKTSVGGKNTKLGLSLNFINNVTTDTEFFVAEMGMDRLGEIDSITELFNPDVAVITTINTTHIEKLESIVNITKAKAEVLNHLKKDALVLLNSDNRYTKRIGMECKCKVEWFGSKDQKRYKLNDIDMPGEHNKLNLMIAIKVAKHFGIDDELIYKNLDKLKLQKGRLNIINGLNGSTIIDDSYNANPDSTKNAIDVLISIKGGKKYAILGDMLELGKLSSFYHKNLGKYISKKRVDVLVCVGEKAKDIVTGIYNRRIKLICIDNSEDFKNILDNLDINEGDVVLVKGSQGARMEKVVFAMMSDTNKAAELLVRQDATWQ